MKPVFKCEYCTFMGTEEEVKTHEDTCANNYDKKSCFTCQHREYLSLKQIKCNAGKEIPENMIFENCEKYKRKEESNLNTSLGGLFGSFCGF